MRILLFFLGIALIVISEVVGSPDTSEGSLRRKLDFRDVEIVSGNALISFAKLDEMARQHLQDKFASFPTANRLRTFFRVNPRNSRKLVTILYYGPPGTPFWSVTFDSKGGLTSSEAGTGSEQNPRPKLQDNERVRPSRKAN